MFGRTPPTVPGQEDTTLTGTRRTTPRKDTTTMYTSTYARYADTAVTTPAAPGFLRRTLDNLVTLAGVLAIASPFLICVYLTVEHFAPGALSHLGAAFDEASTLSDRIHVLQVQFDNIIHMRGLERAMSTGT